MLRQHQTHLDVDREISESLASSAAKMNDMLAGVYKIVENLTEISRNNLEAERCKLRYLELEAVMRGEGEEETSRVERVFTPDNAGQNRCHRCSEEGHWSNECPLTATNQWFCYYCKDIRYHKGNECPKSKDLRSFSRVDGRGRVSKYRYRGNERGTRRVSVRMHTNPDDSDDF